MKNKKILILGAVMAAIIIIGGTIWYFNFQRPRNIAIKEYKSAVEMIEKKNSEIDKSTIKLQALIDSNEKPLDVNIIVSAKDTIKKAEVSKILVKKMPDKTDDIIVTTKELSDPVDNTVVIKELNEIFTVLDMSIKQFKQLNNPKEEFVIERLKTIDEITDVQAVTEDNDPNGKLNKAGGYTATVYFESKNVNHSEVYGSNLIDKGTDAGGSIEVYANEEDAIKRNEYLAVFDGGIFSSGSHRVVGTMVIRTSNLLTASQQKTLEEKIFNAMIDLK